MKMLMLSAMGLIGHMVAMAEETENGGGGPTAPWVAGQSLTTETQPAPGEIGISPSAVPVVVADPAEYRVPRDDEQENPIPERTERVAEAPRLHAVEGRDKWETTPLTTVLQEQRDIDQNIKTPIESLSVDPATGEVAVGATTQLTTVATPAGAVSNALWASNAPAIATVDRNGLVRGMAAGTAVITATSTVDPSKVDTSEITVTA